MEQEYEIGTSLDIKWSKRGWVANGPYFGWNLKSGSPTIWNLDKWLPFCQNHLKSGQKCPYWMVRTVKKEIAETRPFENQNIWNPTFKKSAFQIFLDFKWSDFRSSLYQTICVQNSYHCLDLNISLLSDIQMFVTIIKIPNWMFRIFWTPFLEPFGQHF